MKFPSENNEENQKPGPVESGDPETGQNPVDAEKGPTTARPGTTPRLVGRVTALRGQSIARPKVPKSMKRRQTQQDIYSENPEIPYVKFEVTARDLVCSLMERQDRMNEEIFLKINDLAYRVDDLDNDDNGKKGGK
jgi:hypothetical protein